MKLVTNSVIIASLGGFIAATAFFWMHFGGDVYAAYIANAVMACF